MLLAREQEIADRIALAPQRPDHSLRRSAPTIVSIKHGRYTANAIANRREIAALVRAMNGLARSSREGD
jgi:hypothetical protein